MLNQQADDDDDNVGDVRQQLFHKIMFCRFIEIKVTFDTVTNKNYLHA